MQLNRFLMKLAHETVSMELKDGSQVTGTIQSVSISMNMQLRAVKWTPKNGPEQSLDTFSVRGLFLTVSE
jgi:small nuclear ribonucleoprotein D1